MRMATQGAVGVLCRLSGPRGSPRVPRRAFLCGSTGALRHRRSSTSWTPSQGRLRVAMAKNSVLVRHADPAMEDARARSEASGQTESPRSDSMSTPWSSVRLRCRHVGPRRAASSSKPRSFGSPAAHVVASVYPRFVITAPRRRDHLADLPHCRSRRHRVQSDQGTPRWARRPHELLSLLAESTARAPDRRGLRAHARTRLRRSAHRLCARPGDLAARPVAIVIRRGPRRRLRTPHHSPPAVPRPRTSTPGGASRSRSAPVPG